MSDPSYVIIHKLLPGPKNLQNTTQTRNFFKHIYLNTMYNLLTKFFSKNLNQKIRPDSCYLLFRICTYIMYIKYIIHHLNCNFIAGFFLNNFRDWL